MGFVMLTEPLTTPPTEKLQIIYGAIVGLLFVPGVHIGSFYSTPELALLLGNIFAYVVSPKEKLIMQVEEKIQLTKDTFDFVFKPEKRFSFAPGQYMEWTLPHEHPDNRGNRRYFTLASSPTEMDLRIGVKFYLPASSFKRALANLPSDQEISAAQRAGDFTLPANKKQKLVLIAGGIGVTPYRSMLKYLIDTKEKRDVVVVYSNREKEEIVYQDVLGEAEKKLGVRIVYTLTDEKKIPDNWQGGRGRINEDMITKNIPDYRDRLFYISGPFALVSSTEKMLLGMGLAKDQIKTDFFPGFV
jgi:ferredoxin-NADP reductase